MDKIELLDGVLTKTGDLLEGTKKDMKELPTPCPEFRVEDLVNHMVGWTRVFDANCNSRSIEGDANQYQCKIHPATEYKTAATSLLDGWKKFGFDRKVQMMSNELPAESVFNMTVMEAVTHGWDLAVATGQPIPYTEQEAEEILTRAEATLPAQYRGPDKPFAQIVEVSASAPAIDRLAGFMGRNP
ncbi:MAG: TIGR03086 family metal-binding protein [Ilumatobacteraceae bacterium]